MFTLSLCMIVKDEEAVLGRCLSSVCDIADEIIVVDTGSKDRTKEIAAGFSAKVYDFPWIDDFSAARNFSFSKADCEYIMWLDADDVLLPGDARELAKLKADGIDADAVMMRYNTSVGADGKPAFYYYRERLVKRSRGFLWQEPVHEYIAVVGKTVTSEIAVTHQKPGDRPSRRNLDIYRRELKKRGSLTPRGMYYYARELKDNAYFARAATWFKRFLQSGKGWSEDCICACAELAACLQRLGKPGKALAALFKSFEYDTPRPVVCCRIGYFFKDGDSLKSAVYWFERALTAPPPSSSFGFTQPQYSGFVPAIELAVCYDRLGNTVLAQRYNELAASFNPDSAAVESNRKYFAAKLGEK